jgi:DNA-nicking Smr family endonuclease
LRKFIADAQARGVRAVRIVHGKGHGSERGPVLKSKVDRWLRQSKAVLAFCYAQPQRGGSGATDVLLKILPSSAGVAARSRKVAKPH